MNLSVKHIPFELGGFSREKGALIDASYGRRTQAVLIMDSDHVILSGIPLESLTGRANEETEEKRK